MLKFLHHSPGNPSTLDPSDVILFTLISLVLVVMCYSSRLGYEFENFESKKYT